MHGLSAGQAFGYTKIYNNRFNKSLINVELNNLQIIEYSFVYHFHGSHHLSTKFRESENVLREPKNSPENFVKFHHQTNKLVFWCFLQHLDNWLYRLINYSIELKLSSISTMADFASQFQSTLKGLDSVSAFWLSQPFGILLKLDKGWRNN